MIVLNENTEMEENSSFLIEPNRVAEYYRNYHYEDGTCNIEKQLNFIEISADGHTLLGSSNMNGRRWEGSMFYFDSPDDLPDENKSICRTPMQGGVTDAKFLAANDVLVVGEDTGALSVYAVSQPYLHTDVEGQEMPLHFMLQGRTVVHDDGISTIESFPSDPNSIITGSLDCSITMWDADAMASHVSYQFAHSCAVTDISCIESSTDIFASGGLDHLALLWDRRQSKPARLALNAQHGVTAVAWCNTSAIPVLAVALVTGEVAMVDTRQECSVLSKIRPFVRKRPIHKLRHCATRPELLAVCADDTSVGVLDCSNPADPKVRYWDDRHEDFVRGLAWSPSGHLYSCGFDTAVLRHDVV